MSTANFVITEHTSPCSYLRQYPHGAKRDDSLLHLAIKEYRPSEPFTSSDESVTIIAASGIGFPKEMYEPLFNDIHTAPKSFSVDSIWIADVATQGASYALNAAELGDDVNWQDHALDLFLMINRFRDKMKPPFIGIGHSMGCAQIVHLASIHPRLFHSLILIDPVMLPEHPPGPHPALFPTIRRDKWDSRAQAEAQMRRSPFFAAMDPRALDLFLTFGLRDTPDGGVVLATPKAQEAWSYARSNFLLLSEDREMERMLNPDFEPGSHACRLLTSRGELIPINDALPHLRPRTFFVYGEYSNICHEEVQQYYNSTTGSGRGGNGGAKEGGMKYEEFKDCGHLCVFEKPGVIAKSVAGWLGDEMARWKREKQFWDTVDTKRSKNGGKELSDEWIEVVKLDTQSERPKAGSAKL